MKKLIETFTDNRGKIKVKELINNSIVFNFKTEPTKLIQKKVTDAFEGYLEIAKEWVKLADITIHFVIVDTVEEKPSIEEFFKKLPNIPPYDSSHWRSPPLVPEYRDNKCSKCGLVCEGVMGYCCPNYNCPMGMGGTWCSTTAIHQHFDH